MLERQKANVIIDGQWGSTGKGKLAGYLYADHIKNGRGPLTAVCDFMPNAGHTVYLPDGRAVVTRQLPTGAAFEQVQCVIGPHAAIDYDQLMTEIEQTGCKNRLTIDPMAVMVHDDHREIEANVMQYLSSTMKGGHAATCDKIMRRKHVSLAMSVPGLKRWVKPAGDTVRENMAQGHTVLVETAQGFDLGLNHGTDYPYVTGRDCLIGRALDNAGIPVGRVGRIWASLRTYPIRVGSIAGTTSGDCHPDQREMTWPEIGQPPETTTVTGRIRRVFSWSDMQVIRFLEAVRPTHAFLNFVNYLQPNDFFVDRIGQMLLAYGCDLRLLGTGPRHEDMLEV